MKLFIDPGNFQAVKILSAAKFSNSEAQVERISVKSSECVVPNFSRSKLPVLEISEGKFLFSPNAAAKYLLLKAGIVANEDAENEILDWENEKLLPVVAAFLVNTIGHGKKDKVMGSEITKVIKFLEARLGKSKFLTGDSIGLGDICVYATLFPLTLIKNLELLEKMPNTLRWLSEVGSNSSIQSAVAEVTGGKGQDVFKASLLSQTFPVSLSSLSLAPSASDAPKSNKKSATQSASEDQITFDKVTPEELETARLAWSSDLSSQPKPRERVHPILPKKNERNLLVTSALPYVNNVPHLGNIIGCVLSADVFSRFGRLRRYNIIYLCGTDEYGTATETKALAEGLTPQQVCDKYNKLHVEIYKWFNIDFDIFGRTTTQKQTEIAQDIFWKLYNGGYVIKDSVDQLKCMKCDKFLADRFVEGTCPLCGFNDARGDQCDGCGKLINAVELKNPQCKICRSSPVLKTSNHLFVDLPKLDPELRKHHSVVFESGTWTHNAEVITTSWLKEGLKPRCISRDLKWGTPVPLEGYTDKVFYVWFDAPIGYISITANYTDKWEEWWKNPSEVEMYNFLGKDNVPFHSVVFPACQIGAKDNYTLVNHMIATEYLNYEDTKFSKSRGTGVFGDQAEKTGIPADIYRFYLLFVRPESQDSAFSWDDFMLKNNSELLNNLGNFINRALMFLNNNFGGEIQAMPVTEEDFQLMALVTRELKEYIGNLEVCKIRDGLRNILSISRLGNQYMQLNKPWVLCKGSADEKKRAGAIVSLCANISCLISVLLQPYMPVTSATIQEQLNAPASVNVITDKFVPHLRQGHKIGKPSPLFQKIEEDTIASLKKQFAGKQEEKAPAKSKAKSGKSASNAGGEPNAMATQSNPEEVERLTKAVTEQGNKVRDLKAAKAEKAVVDAEVKILLQLKKDLTAAGEPNAMATQSNPEEVERLTKAVTEQGVKVRDLKAAKAEKAVVDGEVKILLQLKKDLTAAGGVDPGAAQKGSSKKNKKKGGQA